MTVSTTVRSRLEAQGFCGLDDAPLRRWAHGCGGLQRFALFSWLPARSWNHRWCFGVSP